MFSECSSLTSLNLFNFHINNNTNIENLFYKLNKKCKIICKDKIILNKYKMITYLNNIIIFNLLKNK